MQLIQLVLMYQVMVEVPQELLLFLLLEVGLTVDGQTLYQMVRIGVLSNKETLIFK